MLITNESDMNHESVHLFPHCPCCQALQDAADRHEFLMSLSGLRTSLAIMRGPWAVGVFFSALCSFPVKAASIFRLFGLVWVR